MLNLAFIINGVTKETFEEIKQSFDDVIRPEDVNVHLVVWLHKEQSNPCCITGDQDVRVVHADGQPLSDISFLLANLPVSSSEDEDAVVIIDSSVFSVQPNLVELLMTKITEHDVFEDNNILTSTGFKLFPHKKCTNGMPLVKGVHWKQYNEMFTDREVHIFTDDFCLIPLKVLVNVADLQDRKPIHDNSLWLSYVMSTKLDPPVNFWKIKMAACLSKVKPNEYTIDSMVSNNGFHSLYSEMYDAGWPRGISELPQKASQEQPNGSMTPASSASIWSNGFCGVNMQIHPASELDLEAAAAYGIKVIRIGAVADAADLSYLLDKKSKSSAQDELHLLKVLPRLKTALAKAGSLGIKVIITMVDLPESPFLSEGNIEPFWTLADCRERVVKFWYTMASNLLDVRDTVIGYDIINEPYTVEDTECDYFDDMPLAHADILMEFYTRVIKKIRTVDSTVGILLKGQWFASPRAFEVLKPVDDDNVYYGFHAYISPLLALRRIFHFDSSKTPPSYPGYVRKWVNVDEEILITFETLRKLLMDTVRAWQLKHKVSSRKIIVAEFGITRETPGAQDYLSDLIKIFNEFEWSWLVFSFRDEEWDALNYELGPHMDNMLYHSSTPLFQTVAKHFH